MPKYMDFFPFKRVREVQGQCMELVSKAINEREHVIMHAPTGLGKTAAVLVPALRYALEEDKTVMFLTSRNTQHTLAMDTVRLIREKSGRQILGADIIGKQWMCSVEHVDKMYSSEFADYCKKTREDGRCEFYSRTKKSSGGATVEAKLMVDELARRGSPHVEDVVEEAKGKRLCPYEIAAMLAARSQVIVADYHYLFHPHIRKVFLARIRKQLEDCIVVVDEAHNLPDRIRETLTVRLSSNNVRYAIREAKKYNESAIEKLVLIQEVLNQLTGNEVKERRVARDQLMRRISSSYDYEGLVEELKLIGDDIREQQHRSFIARIAEFLDLWQSEEQGYARILRVLMDKQPAVMLTYRCLDPSVGSSEVISNSHSTVLMSGTLNPTYMYKDILGFDRETAEEVFPSPFPQENRLALIVPKTTTKFSSRNQQQFLQIGRTCSELAMTIPGNVALFFPSYQVRNQVVPFLRIAKRVFVEEYGSNKEDRKRLLDTFKKGNKKGSVLLGISMGSFGEGIDLPGDLLQGVVVVGMPFRTPDLETKELINYYEMKFGKGWDYGYILPTLTSIMQNAGRCIRSEKDRGVIVFLDERYALPRYRKVLEGEWDVEVDAEFKKQIDAFFS
jgi:DNA excision repair protein ERCC-2